MKVLLALTAILASPALQAQSVSDWRLLGNTLDSAVFYDAKGIRKLPDGHFEVWLKTLPSKAIEKAKLDKAQEEAVARKMAAGYVPPVTLTNKLTPDQITGIVIGEEIADAANIEPTLRMLVEVDCQNRTSRNLSIQWNMAGTHGSSEKGGEWEHIAPETNMATLLAAICPKS